MIYSKKHEIFINRKTLLKNYYNFWSALFLLKFFFKVSSIYRFKGIIPNYKNDS